MKSPQHRIEMAQRRARRQQASLIPLYDEYTGQPVAPLIGWYNLNAGIIYTPDFTPSFGGMKGKPNKAHDARVLALNNRVKLAVEEVATSVDAEAPAES
jgi:hypothetical protein